MKHQIGGQAAQDQWLQGLASTKKKDFVRSFYKNLKGTDIGWLLLAKPPCFREVILIMTITCIWNMIRKILKINKEYIFARKISHVFNSIPSPLQ